MPSSARVLLGDCIDVMATLEEASIDAVVCDPPYGLEFMGKDWDTFRMDERSARWSSRSGEAGGFGEIPSGGKLPNYGKRRTTSRCRRCNKRDAFRNPHACDDLEGGADWIIEYVDVVPVEMRAFQNWCHSWALEAYRVLKPGGHLLAFGGTRTYHRLTVALEDAGFDIRDSLHWIYGQGFPKSLNVAKQIDKAGGAEGDADAKEWAGWGTALKPAHEPIVLARKPLAGNTVTSNIIEYRTGGLHIAAVRVGDEGGTNGGARNENGRPVGEPSAVDIAEIDVGRWPSNVLLAHLVECEGHGALYTEVLCAPGCPVAELNEASGETASTAGPRDESSSNAEGEVNFLGDNKSGAHYGDAGGAARFFYIAKPRRRERIGGTIRNLHPTVKPLELMRYLVRMVTAPGGIVLDPFLGSGTTGCAAMVEGFHFVGIESDAASHETALARIADYAFAHGQERPTVT